MEVPILLAVDTTDNWNTSDVALGNSELAIEIQTKSGSTELVKRLLIGDRKPVAPDVARLRVTPDMVGALSREEIDLLIRAHIAESEERVKGWIRASEQRLESMMRALITETEEKVEGWIRASEDRLESMMRTFIMETEEKIEGWIRASEDRLERKIDDLERKIDNLSIDYGWILSEISRAISTSEGNIINWINQLIEWVQEIACKCGGEPPPPPPPPDPDMLFWGINAISDIDGNLFWGINEIFISNIYWQVNE